jgi:hypothetical protein
MGDTDPEHGGRKAVDVKAPIVQAMFSAVQEDCHDLLPPLLAGDDSLVVQRNADGHNLLMIALANGAQRCVDFLLSCRHAAALALGATVGGVSALMLAAATGRQHHHYYPDQQDCYDDSSGRRQGGGGAGGAGAEGTGSGDAKTLENGGGSGGSTVGGSKQKHNDEANREVTSMVARVLRACMTGTTPQLDLALHMLELLQVRECFPDR